MYIRINLLPQDLRPKKTLIRFDLRAVLVVCAVAAAVGLALWSIYLQRELGVRTAQAEQLRREQASLRDTVVLQKEVDDLKKKVTERVEIIRGLTEDSDLRFDMLRHINGIIPENLWLLGINEMAQSDRVAYSIEGMSYTKKGISRFLDGLQRYQKFSSVALESITPSPLEVRDAFQFIVRVELTGTRPPVEEKGKKAPAKAAAPAK